MMYSPAQHYVSIDNRVWCSHGGRLMVWLADNFKGSQCKALFAKNPEGHVIAEKPVRIKFDTAEDVFLFRLTMDNYNMTRILDDYFDE